MNTCHADNRLDRTELLDNMTGESIAVNDHLTLCHQCDAILSFKNFIL